jgi:hypothetical protein
MLVRERRKHVRDGLLYTYIYVCVLPYRSALSTAFPLFRDFLCTRARVRLNFQVSEKFLLLIK